MFAAAVVACTALVLPPASPGNPAVRNVRHAMEQLQTTLLAGALAGLVAASPASALGPQDMKIDLSIKAYEEVTCPEELRQGRAGGALGAGAGGGGIAQKCVKVDAVANSGMKKTVDDAGVFGVVTGAMDGMSVLGNGQDGKNDAGQLAMIDKIEPGESNVQFLFVAQQSDPCVPSRQNKCPVQGTVPLQPLKFEKFKAIAYPNGKQFKLYDECEQNEFAEGC